MVSVTAVEAPPPDAGLNPDTSAVPAVAISADVIYVVNWVALMQVVVRAAPLQLTTELLTKPDAMNGGARKDHSAPELSPAD